MRFIGAILLFVVFCGTARANGEGSAARQTAREHYRRGSVAYELGHYDVAIAEYEAAYQAFNEPTLLYNLGQAHRLAKHLPEALHFYRMYLVKVPEASNRPDVESRIAALQTAVNQASSEKPAASPPLGSASPSPSPPAESSAPAAPAAAQPATRSVASSPGDRDQARRLKMGGLAIGIVGLAVVGGGVGVGLLAKSAGDDISRANANHQMFDPTKYSTYQNDQIVAGVLLGVGAAAVIIGTTLAVVGWRRGHAPMTAHLVPQLLPGRAVLSANFGF